MNDVDPHGQPLVRRFSAARLNDRTIDELIGLSRGFLADGEINQSEAEFLLGWLEGNRQFCDQWPFNVLYQRVREMLADGILDHEEQSELIDLLMDLTGCGQPVDKKVHSDSTSLPLCDPPPEIKFLEKVFCFTGKFIYGTRKECQGEVLSRGASIASSPTLKTQYLVIGQVGSTDWIHSTFGRKIEKAMDLREKGSGIGIVSEELWAALSTS